MNKTLKEIAELIEGKVVGDEDVIITGFSNIKEAKPGDITFLANPRYAHLLEETEASAIITSFEVKSTSKNLIQTQNPSLAFAKLISIFSPPTIRQKGIHPTAILGKNVFLGKDVSVGAYTVIEDDVSIGDGTTIYPACFIGYNSKIGKDSLIYPHVSIREGTIIGNRVIIHSGAVIGSDGFGFVTVDGKHHKIPQVGIVEIGDDVEIGANVTIDRARFEKTVIGKGTKIDNLVQIAHNVILGENCLIVAQVGISGSTTIGNNVVLAGQVGVVGHIQIGDNVVVAAQSGVSKSIPANTQVWGYPAKPFALAKRLNACVQRLPKLYKTVEELKKKIEDLEKKLSH
ncbi:MAG: UDP-3-O-(3-hydroxymyristoyl)glucosamine N-acyltransferase [Candidatus Omnitrophica bacterium]|nr:UDP-3-O-(3-hydroxymyristoyl)glucosamine N-acyltransferase [Candidatus Omnitrophota bacterium]MCM8799779.1 UDP-3-O-(3-hydroxymyristoyl)glucosamine N-acyltransferase [Candidatus Omnitrophota bacterium]